ncbi:MAG: hypothetical protein ACK5LC_03090 [Coprobacillaceae bacterium]
MKSSKHDLEKRGYIEKERYNDNSFFKKELLEMITNDVALIRSKGVLLLKENYNITKEDIKLLLTQLTKEKALYTKIYICETLTSLGAIAAKEMIPYLGMIGNNQHKVIPDWVSKKKNYPLARDIIARALAFMEPEVFPILLEILDSNDQMKIAEGLDAIGYIMFYHPKVINKERIDRLYQLYTLYQDNVLITWRIVTCLSACTKEQGEELLEKISKEQDHPTIQADIERTRKLRPNS